MKKYQNFLSKNFQFLEVKFSIYLNRRVFVMYRIYSDPSKLAASNRVIKLAIEPETLDYLSDALPTHLRLSYPVAIGIFSPTQLRFVPSLCPLQTGKET